ncbi:hypothetical protein EDD22DRAFT_146956 [Suillus occidentalis]|nr:hypothetical protein EDD22DRAFT_146956 [Suillus occidentalis]
MATLTPAFNRAVTRLSRVMGGPTSLYDGQVSVLDRKRKKKKKGHSTYIFRCSQVDGYGLLCVTITLTPAFAISCARRWASVVILRKLNVRGRFRRDQLPRSSARQASCVRRAHRQGIPTCTRSRFLIRVCSKLLSSPFKISMFIKNHALAFVRKHSLSTPINPMIRVSVRLVTQSYSPFQRHLGTTFWDFIAAGFGVISQCGVTGSHFTLDADGHESICASMVHVHFLSYSCQFYLLAHPSLPQNRDFGSTTTNGH